MSQRVGGRVAGLLRGVEGGVRSVVETSWITGRGKGFVQERTTSVKRGCINPGSLQGKRHRVGDEEMFLVTSCDELPGVFLIGFSMGDIRGKERQNSKSIQRER